MQAVRSEWVSLQAQFAPLALKMRLLRISDELKALQEEATARINEKFDTVSKQVVPDSVTFMLRKTQRYVEWTVPALLPDRAEEAEVLVNVNRFAAKLLVQEDAWDWQKISKDLEQQIEHVETICNVS